MKSRELKQLSWRRQDIERKFGCRGARGTKVTMPLMFVFALLSTITLYLLFFYVIPPNHITAMFTDRGSTPYPITLLGFWIFYAVLFKSRKLALQRKVLQYDVLPKKSGFILTPFTVDEVIRKINQNAETPYDFILYNRILLTLSNLKNIGRVSDVNALLESQAGQDSDTLETSYTMINGFLWAVPILGFIGTVLGLSSAIGGFGAVLTTGTDMEELLPALRNVTGGLSTAFETTLVALVIALVLQLWTTHIRKREEEFLDECTEFCSRNIVSRLRMDYVETDDEC